ncbi:helix-turn-helix domain-containing protein [Agrobacterium sp. CMT1]|uniref:helix-turn-helix domain-containing protein n=1 Tax=Agrobacterium sp. CMT1 TaxID=3128901 RepID=UPI0030778468
MANETHPLTEYLERTGRSLTEVADAAKCSRMTLYRLMKGEQNATIDLLKRISAATGGEVSVSSFLGEGEAA